MACYREQIRGTAGVGPEMPRPSESVQCLQEEPHVSAGCEPVVDSDVSQVLCRLTSRGVQLWCEQGRLHYRAPKGILSSEELASLKEYRTQITALLEQRERGGEPTRPSCSAATAPLSYSQLLHWRSSQLAVRPAIRHIASATRLSGSLNVQLLRESLRKVIDRQEALRTRIVMEQGDPTQQIDNSIEVALEVEDLSGMPQGAREEEARHRVEDLIIQPIDLARGPLAGFRLMKVGDEEHVLGIALEHIISDAYSMGLLLRELFTLYADLQDGDISRLPPVGMSFADYARWQRGPQSDWIETHGPYWRERLGGCRRLRFPDDPAVLANPQEGWGKVGVHIDRELKFALRQWARAHRTTIVLGVLSAYVAVVLRWCECPDAVFQYQTDGRSLPGTESTIGFLAAELFLRVGIAPHQRFSDLLASLTQEYCKATEHADYSYIAAQVPEPAFARNPRFNWVPQAGPMSIPNSSGSQLLRCASVPIDPPLRHVAQWDAEPSLLLYDQAETVSGAIFFPLERLTMGTMQLFQRNLMTFIRELARDPNQRIADIPMQRVMH